MTSHAPPASQTKVVALLAIIILTYFGWLFTRPAAPVAADAHVAAEHHGDESHAATHDEHGEAGHGAAHAPPPVPATYSIIPFAALLLCIAFFPLMHATSHWWEHNSSKLMVAGLCGLLTLIYYAFLYGHGIPNHLTHTTSEAGIPAAITVLMNAVLNEYIPFIVLLLSLYVISGGIAIEGHLVGRPRLNATIIGIGAIMASFIGTTGAAMLLIRPLLRANAVRQHVVHSVVFFIFVVCNTGGCLLPIGDPPLFLGYLRGVPFLWTVNLWQEFLFMNGSLLAIYLAWDTVIYRKEDRAKVEARPAEPAPFKISGAFNFLLLVGVVLAVALLDPSKKLPGTEWSAPLYFREIVMLTLTAISLAATTLETRAKNSFSYGAILEVACLFIGIFIAMQAPIQLLNVYGPQLGVDTPWKFYWASGILSSFLDNAPTYVVFYETAKSMHMGGETVAGVAPLYLAAISLGSVFMGAMTYIGNGPNFMVKAIAESHNVRMPSFFGYMVYSCLVLLPLSIALTLIFML